MQIDETMSQSPSNSESSSSTTSSSTRDTSHSRSIDSLVTSRSQSQTSWTGLWNRYKNAWRARFREETDKRVFVKWGLILLCAITLGLTFPGGVLASVLGAGLCLVDSYRGNLDTFTASHTGLVMSVPLILAAGISAVGGASVLTLFFGSILMLFTIIGHVVLYTTYSQFGHEIRRDGLVKW